MIYTELENKLIGIRKMLPKVKDNQISRMLIDKRVKAKEKLKVDKSYFFKIN